MPFFGGTYFPPYPKQGMPSFTQLLQSITDAYKNRKKDIELSSKQIVEHVMGFIKIDFIFPPKFPLINQDKHNNKIIISLT